MTVVTSPLTIVLRRMCCLCFDHDIQVFSDEGEKPHTRPTALSDPCLTGSTLISIRQTDVDTLMIRTQSRVRVRV